MSDNERYGKDDERQDAERNAEQSAEQNAEHNADLNAETAAEQSAEQSAPEGSEPVEEKKPEKKKKEDPEYVPPHVNRDFAVVAVTAFMAILLLPTLLWGVINLISPNLAKTLTYDTGENRNMAEFPDKFDPDTVTADIESWYNDNLPFRSILYSTQTELKHSIESKYDEVIFPALLELFHPSDVIDDEEETLPGNNVLDGNVTEEGTGANETEPVIPPFVEPETEPGTEPPPPDFEQETETEPPPPDFDQETETEPPPPDFEQETETLPEAETEPAEDHQKDCDHVFDLGTTTQEPTCGEFGKKVYTCTLCGLKRTESIQKLAHDYVAGRRVEATCQSTGIQYYECSVCGTESSQTVELPLALHKFVAGRRVSATCQYTGTQYYECSVCGTESDKTVELPLTPHNYVAGRRVDPTCQATGTQYYECSVCGTEATEFTELPKKSHNYVLESETPATCQTEGEQFYACSMCGGDAPETVKLPRTSHKGEVVETVEASYEDYGYTLCKCSTCETLFRTNVTAKKVDKSYYPVKYTTNNSVILGRLDWLFYTGGQSIQDYQGSNIMTEDDMAAKTAVVEALRLECEKRGIDFAVLILPNKEQMYDEHMPSLNVFDSYKRVDRLVDYINEHSGVTALYPFDELEAKKPYFQTYMKYDTHWNSAGAFIGAQALYKAIGRETTDIFLTPHTISQKGGGDLVGIGSLDSSKYQNDISYSFQYKTDIEVTTKNGINNHTVFAESNSPNDEHLVFVGDSFRISMLDFLQRDFSEVTTTHRAQVYDADVQSAILDADILVLSSVERDANDIFVKAQIILDLLRSQGS